MSILICAATPLEIASSIAFIGEKRAQDIDLLITGVGLMSTAYALTKAISCKKPKLIIQAGIGGSLSADLVPGSVVAVEKELAGDLGVMEGSRFHSVFELGLAGGNTAPWSGNALVNNHEQLSGSGLRPVTAVSVNEISTNAERIDYYRELGAAVESMEGAALHYVALMEGIPFLQIRSISNFVAERDKSRWKMKEAIEALNQTLQQLINKYEQ